MDIKRFVKQFEDMMTASAFAEAGDYKTAQEILKEGKRVLLALREGEIDNRVLKYALNTCKRIKADLDILYLSSENSGDNPLLQQSFSELQNEGINYNLIHRKGRLRDEIRNYINAERGIHFVVVESRAVDRWNKEEGLSEILEKMKYPLVVVDIP